MLGDACRKKNQMTRIIRRQKSARFGLKSLEDNVEANVKRLLQTNIMH